MTQLVALPALLVLAVLVGSINAAGIWRDSFDPVRISPTRIAQLIIVFATAFAALIGLARSGGTAFSDVPPWALSVAGGGNLFYLGAKWAAARRAQAASSD